MKIEKDCFNEEYWCVEKPGDLKDWSIFFVEEFKPGVKRLHCSQPSVFGGGQTIMRMLYCGDDVWKLCSDYQTVPQQKAIAVCPTIA